MLAAGTMLDIDPATFAAAASAAGYDGIGLRLSHDHAMDGSERSAFRSLLADLGLRMHDVEVHRIGDDHDDIGPLVDAAADIGADSVLIVSDLADRAETEDRLGQAADRCRLSGVRPALEYMAWTLPSEPLEAIEIAGATGCVLVVDLLHHHRVGAGPEELQAIVDSGHLGWVQLCDGPDVAPDDLIHEARHGRLDPGRGELPLVELLDCVPPDVVVSVEVQNDAAAQTGNPAVRAADLAASARAVLNRSGRNDPGART